MPMWATPCFAFSAEHWWAHALVRQVALKNAFIPNGATTTSTSSRGNGARVSTKHTFRISETDKLVTTLRDSYFSTKKQHSQHQHSRDYVRFFGRMVKALEIHTGILFHKHDCFRATVFGSVHLSILVPSVASG